MHALSKQVAGYLSLKASMKQLDEKLAEIEGEIKAYMGEQEEITVDGHIIRWKKITQNRFDNTAFRQQHASLYEQFMTASETRRFTVT
jgi:predicted phage-related endonuclease